MKHFKRQSKLIVLEIVFSPIATNSLVEQALYICENTKNIAPSDKYLDEMKDFIISILSAFPNASRASDELSRGTRKLVYKGYSIIYQIQKNRIETLTLYQIKP